MHTLINSIPDIEISENEQSISHFLESELLASLRNSLPQGENTSFILFAKDSAQKVIGGLTASTSYGWLLVKVLWVDSENRGLGLGRALMQRAEHKGIELGCHGAWLDTSNPSAIDFYLMLGYEEFGLLSNVENQQPENHKRWFMKKYLQ